ncbi:phosphate ABC transporter permease PstA [Flavobacteriales bacterium]|jgi:phosphate transport system permease protein|nr:phosphate ABC transporter permease PstA [Flavobacteriales bacterium]
MINVATKNRIKDKLFEYWGVISTLIGVVLLVVFMTDIFMEGISRIDATFFTNSPSGLKPETSGIFPALLGTLWILILTASISIPLGVGAGIYLEEYSEKNWVSSLLEINISNLAGVPSIIYGLLGLEVFVRIMGLGKSVVAGALTLSLLVLPIVIVATREAIKSVPNSIKQAAYGLGATKWQTIWTQVLPSSIGGILTGVILALSRAIGETAPLIVVGAAAYIYDAPDGLLSEYTVIPMQIYTWMPDAREAMKVNAAAGIIVLLMITLVMNGFAVYLRNRWQKKVKW